MLLKGPTGCGKTIWVDGPLTRTVRCGGICYLDEIVKARDYLPHMYGAAHYIILDEVRLLPVKVADIYRWLTTEAA